MILFTTFALAAAFGDGVTMTFVPSGAMERTGGYSPVRAEFTATPPAGVKVKPEGATGFGAMKFGTHDVLFAVGDGKIWVDSNNNGNLTDDPAVDFKPNKRGEYTMYMGSAKADIGKGQPVGINFYRFDPNDPSRAALKNTLLFYGDFGYDVTLTLDGKTSKSFVSGEPTANTRLSVDRNGDGKQSFYYEAVQVGKPFNFTGTTYVLNLKDGKLSLDKSATAVDQLPMPPTLVVGSKVLPFKATTTDGKTVNFPEDYKGKVVMLDFWATWCGPCMGEVPNVVKTYEAYHDKGFEILGISFDQANSGDKVASVTKDKGMTWRQVYEGKFWDTTIGHQYDIASIPAAFLVDGSTGEILAVGNSLRGDEIMKVVGGAVAKLKAGN
jgi:thiol-disulfide isomerase/thioredoxin